MEIFPIGNIPNHFRSCWYKLNSEYSYTPPILHQGLSNAWPQYEAAGRCRCHTQRVQWLESHSMAGRPRSLYLMAGAQVLRDKGRAEREAAQGRSWKAGLEGELSPSPVPLSLLVGPAGARGRKVSFMLFWVTDRSRGAHSSAESSTGDHIGEWEVGNDTAGGSAFHIKLANFPSGLGLMGYRRPGLRGIVSPASQSNGNHMVVMEHHVPLREHPPNNI